jgi:hypothetical protein
MGKRILRSAAATTDEAIDIGWIGPVRCGVHAFKGVASAVVTVGGVSKGKLSDLVMAVSSSARTARRVSKCLLSGSSVRRPVPKKSQRRSKHVRTRPNDQLQHRGGGASAMDD